MVDDGGPASNDPTAATASQHSGSSGNVPAAAATVAQGPSDLIEIDSASSGGDTDSALDSGEIRSVTTSLTSSAYNFKYANEDGDDRFENGRRYHAFREGAYLFPNDDHEQNRLDMLHHISGLILNGKLFKAPITKPFHQVLDFGTGTGIWAIDFADTYPSAHVKGTDLSPIQPTWLPPNLEFVVDDCEAEWREEEHGFYDFIHGRHMAGSVADWPKLFGEIFRALKPGGWLELQEIEALFHCEGGTLPPDSKIAVWQDFLGQASVMFGKELHVTNDHRDRMVEAGFEDVRDDIVKIPIGSWPRDPRLKDQGRWMQAQVLDAVPALSLGYCTRVLKWSESKTRTFISDIQSEFLNNETHLFSYGHFIYGRKPEAA